MHLSINAGFEWKFICGNRFEWYLRPPVDMPLLGVERKRCEFSNLEPWNGSLPMEISSFGFKAMKYRQYHSDSFACLCRTSWYSDICIWVEIGDGFFFFCQSDKSNLLKNGIWNGFFISSYYSVSEPGKDARFHFLWINNNSNEDDSEILGVLLDHWVCIFKIMSFILCHWFHFPLLLAFWYLFFSPLLFVGGFEFYVFAEAFYGASTTAII